LTYPELVNLVGLKNTEAFLKKYGGKQVYIPSLARFYLHLRDLRIYNDWVTTDLSQVEVAEKWGLSLSSIKRIIKKMKKEAPTT